MAAGTFFFNTGQSYNDRSKVKANHKTFEVGGTPSSTMTQRKALSGQVGAGAPKATVYRTASKRRRG